MDLWKSDKVRKGSCPAYQYWFRKLQSPPFFCKTFCKIMYRIMSFLYHCEIGCMSIGPGLYIGHPFGITINPHAKMGKNCNIHKGVTIGQENRGSRKGAPSIGNEVWIGVNSTIVGAITIGDDVLIAPNAYVNCDVPSHSILYGNPCIIKHKDNATGGYINNKI